MFVTIKAKGIYDPDVVEGAAGYAFVVSMRDSVHQIDGGPITEGVGGSTESEAYAVWKGLERAADLEWLDPGSRVRIVTDCRELVAILLALIPVSRCLGPDAVASAVRIGGKIRGAKAIDRIKLYAYSRRLDLEFVIEATDDRTRDRARAGMRMVRAGR